MGIMLIPECNEVLAMIYKAATLEHVKLTYLSARGLLLYTITHRKVCKSTTNLQIKILFRYLFIEELINGTHPQ